jgi:hypothetical protein
MKENLKIAKEMLEAAKELMAVNDYSKRRTFNQTTGLKLNQSQFKSVKESLADDEDDISNEPMEKIAEELLAVASELMKED